MVVRTPLHAILVSPEPLWAWIVVRYSTVHSTSGLAQLAHPGAWALDVVQTSMASILLLAASFRAGLSSCIIRILHLVPAGTGKEPVWHAMQHSILPPGIPGNPAAP